MKNIIQKNKPKSNYETKREMNQIITKKPKKGKMTMVEPSKPIDVKSNMLDTTAKVQKPRANKSNILFLQTM